MKVFVFTVLLAVNAVHADTKNQMQRAFQSLIELIPYITDETAFLDKKNEKKITEQLNHLQTTFKNAKHQTLLQQDVFAPSYDNMNDYLAETANAFKQRHKDYANWRLKEITSNCIACHSRLPVDHPSSFREGRAQIDEKKIPDAYNRGIIQLLVRLYPEAKGTFTALIDEKLIKNDLKGVDLPLKQLLVIQTKILRDPEGMEKIIDTYLSKKALPESTRTLIAGWKKDLKPWLGTKIVKATPTTKEDISQLLRRFVNPSFKKDTYYEGKAEVPLLFSSGIISNFLFENPETPLAPELLFEIGRIEKYLSRDEFFSSGDQFLKLCVRKYPKSAHAPKCLREYKESVDFEFTGSRGTEIPADIKKELNELESLLK